MQLQNSMIFSRAGAARPSPVQTLSDMVRPTGSPADHMPREAGAVSLSDAAETVDLTGLIRRRAPVRYNPAEDVEHKAAAAVVKLEKRIVDLAKVKAASAIMPDVPAATPATPKRRRQLTVRLDQERFAALNRLAKVSGRTYQDIQAQAIAAYLDAQPAE